MAQIIIGGATGWTGSAVAKAIKKHDLHRLVGAVVGPNSKDLGKDLGHLIDPDKCSWDLPLSGDLQKNTQRLSKHKRLRRLYIGSLRQAQCLDRSRLRQACGDRQFRPRRKRL